MTAEKNPFPRKSVVALDGAAGVAMYTLVTPQFARAKDKALEYLDDGVGQVVSVSGPYGSGKSHLINFAISAVNAAAPHFDGRVVQIYQKALDANFALLYKGLVQQIGYQLLKELNDRFLSIVASTEMTGEAEENKKNALLSLLPEDKRKEVEAQYKESTEKVLDRLRADPTVVYQYLDNLIIQPETIYDQRAQLITGENFKKAFFYLPDPGLGTAAYKWFTMDELSDQELTRLGVSGRLSSSADAKYALSLLVILFHHSNIRLLVYLDQIEKLLLSVDEKTLDENRGILFSLAENFPREKAFLALTGAEDGWALMREDFWSRVGPTRIQLGQIPGDWARALLDVYLNQKESDTVARAPDEADIKPFTFAAADEMLRISNGNIRVFLQICHDVYFKADGNRDDALGPAEVKDVIARRVDEGSVSAEVQGILRSRGFSFELQPELGLQFKPDFVISGAKNPSAVIEIVNSLFYVDEAQNAVDVAAHRNELSTQYPAARFIVVSIGYASAEVEESLESVVDKFLVYDQQSFAEKFGIVLDSLSVTHAASAVAEPEIQSQAQDSLQDLLAEREKEISNLNERLKALSEQQRADVLPRQKEWRTWLREDQEKGEKRLAELEAKSDDERKRLQDTGEKTRSRKFVIGSLIYIVSTLTLSVFLLFYRASPFRFFYYNYNFELAPALTLTFLSYVAVFSSIYYLIIYRRYMPLGFKTSEIGKYSGDLSQLILRARTTAVSKNRAHLCLKNPNPIIRYFGALVFLVDKLEDSTPTDSIKAVSGPEKKRIYLGAHWSRLAAIEGWKPLYLAYLKMAFRDEDLNSTQVLFDLLLEANADDPRIVYLISTLPDRQRQQMAFRPAGLNAASPAYVKVLTHAVFEHAIQKDTDWWRIPAAQEPLAEFARSLAGYAYGGRLGDLAGWFQDRGQFWHSELKGTVELDLSEEGLRAIIDTLSPHRESGLASFRDLPISNYYLRLYRFFSEIQWRIDQGDVTLKQ